MSIKQKIIHKALWKLTELIPNRTEIIKVDNTPYLRRFHIVNRKQSFKIPFIKKTKEIILPFAINLHYFYRQDNDRFLHNHPWKYAKSYILTGGYKEERKVGNDIVIYDYYSGDVNELTKDDFHRIVQKSSKFPHTWTLFITGKRLQDYNSRHDDWGFWDSDLNQFVPQKDFLSNKK